MAISSIIINAGFESGDSGWTKDSNWSIDTARSYTGLYAAGKGDSDPGTATIVNDNQALCAPGTVIKAQCFAFGVGRDGNRAGVILQWLDSGSAVIGTDFGNQSAYNSPGTWQLSAVTATAPAGTMYVRIGATGTSVSGGACQVDDFSWDYTSNRVATLTSPFNGSTYTTSQSILLKVNVTGTTPDITSVTYKDDATTLTTVVAPDYSYNLTALAAGSHIIVADVLLASGEVIVSNAATITVTAIIVPPITREFKASNTYSYLVGSSFSGLSSLMPLTARVTGVEVVVDYGFKALIRSSDIGMINSAGSNANVLFDIVNTGTIEAVLLSKDGSTYTTQGSGIVASVPIARSDFDITEEATSESKKWTVMTAAGEQATIGDATSLFGLPTIAASDFINKSLGLRFYPNLGTKPSYANDGDACIRFAIDKVRMRVYFDAGSAEYYFASPDKTEIIKGNLVSAEATGGDFETGDASGILQLDSTLTVTLGSQTWIGDDWTIHAATPPTDANQIGTVAARELNDGVGMSYNGLPSTQAIVDNRSRYEFITANFFAVKSLDSIYGVHGLERAFAFNGSNFYKIYTQKDETKDKPRHVAYHHGHLALGFDDGRLDLSVIGKPYSFDGSLGASEWSIGDAITGLLPLSGTILGVFGSKSIWGLNGTTVDNFGTQVLSPNIGAIEYTVADMGFPVYANAYGIYTLAQTQQYGDYLGTPMSQEVSPWLRPRLLRKYTSDKEVVVAWPVRAKNQYRLAFNDGYIMSMTLNAGGQEAPNFSFQQYNIGTDV